MTNDLPARRRPVSAARALLVCIALATPAGAQEPSPAALFEQANSLYRSGELSRSESLYRRVLTVLPESAPARHNLGNALYRQRRWGAALQQYLSVLRRWPRDARARNNAAAAHRKLAAELPRESHAVLARPLAFPLSRLSPAEIAWVAVGTLHALALLTAVAVLRPRLRRVAAWSGGVILLAAVAFGVAAGWAWMRRSEALLLAPGAGARAAPSRAQPVVLTLPEGAGLRIVAESGGWALVSLPNGLAGWLPVQDIGRIP